MAKVICIMGESGAGKTTSLRTLNPKETLYIDCDGKGLSWKGWKKQYSVENKNYLRIDDKDVVLRTLMRVNGENILDDREDMAVQNPLTHFKYVVIDTLNSIMVSDEMKRAKQKGYDKWQDLAASVYLLIKCANSMRDDLTVIFCAHTETIKDDDGYMFTHIKTNGKKLNKIGLETILPVVLLATRNSDGKYVFETQSNNSTAKTPLGAFEDFEIDNDIQIVLKALDEF